MIRNKISTGFTGSFCFDNYIVKFLSDLTFFYTLGEPDKIINKYIYAKDGSSNFTITSNYLELSNKNKISGSGGSAISLIPVYNKWAILNSTNVVIE